LLLTQSAFGATAGAPGLARLNSSTLMADSRSSSAQFDGLGDGDANDALDRAVSHRGTFNTTNPRSSAPSVRYGPRPVVRPVVEVCDDQVVSAQERDVLHWVARNTSGVCDGDVSGDEDREPAL